MRCLDRCCRLGCLICRLLWLVSALGSMISRLLWLVSGLRSLIYRLLGLVCRLGSMVCGLLGLLLRSAVSSLISSGLVAALALSEKLEIVYRNLGRVLLGALGISV